MSEFVLKLHPGREKSLRRRHAWIFSGAVAELSGSPAPGETVTVVDGGGRFLARAAWSPDSQLVARVWSFDENEAVDDAFSLGRFAGRSSSAGFSGTTTPKGGAA